MVELLKSVMARVVKGKTLEGKHGKQLLSVEYSKSENHVPMSEMEVGESTRKSLDKLKSDQQKPLLMRMKQFYLDTTKYLVGHLPLSNKLLRDVSYLHPLLRKSEHGSQAIRRIAVMLPNVSEDEVALATDEWKLYQAGDVLKTYAKARVDQYWAEIFSEKTLQGAPKYNVLPKVVKTVLSLAHGNADVERSLSANKKTVTPDRASLSDVTINGLRVVKDEVTLSGGAHNIVISKGLLQAGKHAHETYKKRVADEQEVQQRMKKKAEEEAVEERQRKDKEAEKLDANRKKLAVKEKELEKSVKEKDSDLQVAEKLFEEATNRLSEAIKNKDFGEASIAEGLLEVAKKKMKTAREEMKKCSSKRSTLDQSRKRLLEDYSKVLHTTKKRKP